MEKVEKLRERFKSHILTEILNTENIKVFTFRKEDTVNLSQRWIIDRGTLIVQGDCYDSIYRWNDSSITLKFLATCDLGYFSSKCIADQGGSNQTEFDSEYASNYLKEIAADHIYEEFGSEKEEIEEIENWGKLDLKEKITIVKPIILRELNIDDYDFECLFCFENVYEAAEFLHNSEYEVLFGIDGWEYCRNLEVKTTVPRFHLAALKEAYSRYPDAF
jgi:hypothetical protein